MGNQSGCGLRGVQVFLTYFLLMGLFLGMFGLGFVLLPMTVAWACDYKQKDLVGNGEEMFSSLCPHNAGLWEEMLNEDDYCYVCGFL